MAESVDCSEFCRLCLVKEQVNTHIFEELGELQQIHVKITACLPIKVAYEDSLPKRICDDCIYKLDQQYQFWNTTVNSEKQLKQWLSIVDEPTPKQETEKNKIKKEKEQEPTVTKTRPRRNARRKAAQNVRLAAAAAIAASDSDAGIGGDDMEIDHFAKEENDSDEDYHDNTESLEENTYTNVGLDSEEQAEAGPSGLQKSGAVASANSGSDNGGAGYLQIKIEEVDNVYWSPNDQFESKSGERPENGVKSTKKKPKRPLKYRKVLKEKKTRKRHTCEECDCEFKYNYLLKKHILKKHTPIDETLPRERTIECDICSKKFTSKKVMARHRKIHFQAFSHHCEICNKGFYCKQTLRAHMNTNHGAKEHICRVCERPFGTARTLRNHLVVHKNTVTDIRFEEHKCDICQKIFDRKIYLTRHMKIHTGDDKDVVCDVCGKNISRCNLSNHLKVHTGEKPFTCHICKRSFRTKYKLRLHSITHNKLTNTPFEEHKCQLCSKVFHHKKYLNSHMKLHTGEALEKCDICGKILHSKQSLRLHINLHNGIKPHSCNICNKSFMKTNTLKVHMYTHTGEKPFKCDVPGCGKTFSQRNNLVFHKQLHTDEKTFVQEKPFVETNEKAFVPTTYSVPMSMANVLGEIRLDKPFN